ncbi:MAG: hypothetical protein NC907_02940 [Candidatus Omnitrophica bacterium]|nr:hypothetical protein [Candidatus Omnitrophota bacterium]
MKVVLCILFSLLAILSASYVFAQSGSIGNGEDTFQEIYKRFSNAPIAFPYKQDYQIVDGLKKLSVREDVSLFVKTKAHLMICLSCIFCDDLVSAYREILKALPLMGKSVPIGQDGLVFSKVKTSIENGVIKDHAGLVSLPELNENARQIAERINLLIEGKENYRKSVEQCSQKYRPILKATIEQLMKDNKLEGPESEKLRKALEEKYLSKIEKDGYFLISDLKQDFSTYLFEKLLSD